MSTGTVWNYRDFIKREHGSEEAIEFEIAIRKYQAEQIGYERERIIKILEQHYIENDEGGTGYCEGCHWKNAYGVGFENHLIALIKGEQK